MFILSGIICTIFDIIINSEKKNRNAWNIVKRLDYSQYLIYGILIGENLNIKGIKTLSIKFYLSLWMIYSMVIVMSYSSLLKASLTFQTYEGSINTFNDVLKNPNHKIAVRGSHIEDLMKVYKLNSLNV